MAAATAARTSRSVSAVRWSSIWVGISGCVAAAARIAGSGPDASLMRVCDGQDGFAATASRASMAAS